MRYRKGVGVMAYNEEGEGQFVSVGVEMIDKHGEDDGGHDG